jgi:FMN phosphatase YigB (HAD superfamily)
LATDIAGARAAGMRAVLIERSLRAHEAAGYLVIERLSGLMELLGNGPAG